MNLKNSGDSSGFEPMTSAMPVQCSNQLSYEVTQWTAGQFLGLMFSMFAMYWQLGENNLGTNLKPLFQLAVSFFKFSEN